MPEGRKGNRRRQIETKCRKSDPTIDLPGSDEAWFRSRWWCLIRKTSVTNTLKINERHLFKLYYDTSFLKVKPFSYYTFDFLWTLSTPKLTPPDISARRPIPYASTRNSCSWSSQLSEIVFLNFPAFTAAQPSRHSPGGQHANRGSARGE